MAATHLVVVPHTHWDREWYMPFERFRKRLVSMVDHMIAVLESDKKFKYFELDGQTIVVEDYLEIRPEHEARLKKLIRQGRIPVGPWYVQPDEFLVSGEAIIRNLRLGIGLARQFGNVSMIGYLPDQFGHIAQMPQILAGFGIQAAVVWRGVGETVQNTQFLWEALDGTRLFTVYLADSYSNGAFLPLKPAALKDRLSELMRRLEPFCDIDSMLIMNGLDHLGAQEGLPAPLEKAARALGVTCEIGNLQIFIQQARRQAGSLSVHRGEFRDPKRAPIIPGVTSSRLRQKRRDFLNCRLLEKYVEPMCAWAASLGDNRPHKNYIDYVWRLTMQNHPHDSICGCSVDPVHEEMETRFDKVEQVATTLTEDAFSFLAGHIDTSWAEADNPVLCVYNPTGAVNQVLDVVADIEEPDFVNSLSDSTGARLPLQKVVGDRELFFGVQESPAMIREQVAGMSGRELLGYYVNNILWRKEDTVLKLTLVMGRAPMGDIDMDKRRKELLEVLNDPSIEVVDIKGVSGAKTRLCFFAKALPPLGLKTYSLSHETPPPADAGPLNISSTLLENAFYRVSVNSDGTLDILDKESGAEFRRCLHFVDEADRGDTYNFDGIPGAKVVDMPAQAVKVTAVEEGPVRATLKLEAVYSIPEKLLPTRDGRTTNSLDTLITTLVSICRDFKRIDFSTSFENQCEDHRLRVLFHAPFATEQARVESTFGIVSRPSTMQPAEGYAEQPTRTGPQKTFTLVENGAIGMALFNRGAPEVEPTMRDSHTSLALTLVRSIGWLSRDDLYSRPAAAGPALATPNAQCKGTHTVEYAFTSYQGDHLAADIVRQAHAYAFPPIAIITGKHKGKLKDASSLVAVDNPCIVPSAVEMPNKGQYHARLYNVADSAQKANVALWLKNAILYEVNLLGRKLSKEPLRKKAGKVELRFRPGEIKTLLITRKR
ncbi:MAG: alpha-mannosidase [Candidatus Abyssubacteria bacterium]